MSSLPISSTCAGCAGPPVPAGTFCSRCGRPGGYGAGWGGPPMPYGQPYPVQVVVAPKSAGVAILLTFLWLGAGHLYLNRVGPGIGLLVLHFVLLLFLATGVGAILAVPGWILAFVLSAVSCQSITNEENARLGAPRPW